MNSHSPTLPTVASAMRIIDLTLVLAEELPCTWPTHMPYQQKTSNYFTDMDDQTSPLRTTDGPYQTRWLLIDEHTGTHFDAPAHFIPEPKTGLPHAAELGTVTAEQISLAQLMGPAVVVDIPQDLPDSAPGISPTISQEFLRGWEDDHGELGTGDIVLLRTGWDRYYLPGDQGLDYCFRPLVTRDGPGWPAPDAGAMQHLIDRGIRCVGTDGVSMGSSHDGAGVHYAGLGGGAVFIEALGHLEALPIRGAFFCFAPIKVARGSGAPGRAFAWIPHIEERATA